MPHTYNKYPVLPEYIPPAQPGELWLENSDCPMQEVALAQYTGYGGISEDLVIREWQPGGKIRWAISLRLQGK